ncbi:MAG: metal-dependent hydrolase [Gemmatimonadota bacterium]
MDNVTHALAGALFAAATVALVGRRSRNALGAASLDESPASSHSVSARFRATAFVVGVVTAELPDADLLYAGQALGMGNLGYLLHHRGHTHTVVFALAAALVVWGVTLLFRKDLRVSPWKWPLLGLAVVGTLSHLLLDYTNSYGVHPFWPINNRWFYGDAVFIIEPWLWVAALPPLILLAVRRWTKVVTGFLLGAILAAVWAVGMVGRDVAIAVTVGTALWIVAARAMREDQRALYGIGAWVAIELMFFVASGAALREVRRATSAATFRDAVLNPAVGNPLCFSALVVELDGGTYRTSNATVAPFPALRGIANCANRGIGARGVEAPDGAGPAGDARTGTSTVAWYGVWERPHTELLQLARSQCELRASMRFFRVPEWERTTGDSIRMFDGRFGTNSFATITTAPEASTCPRHVPGWVPPRLDILGDAALRP